MWERIRRGKQLLRCGVLGGARRFGTHRGRRWAGHIVAAARLQLVLFRNITAAALRPLAALAQKTTRGAWERLAWQTYNAISPEARLRGLQRVLQ